jgi:hypothetical protein
MQENFENPELPETKPKASALTIGMGIVVAVAILLSLWFLFEPLKNGDTASVKETIVLKMNPVEQDYAKKIEVEKIEMSRAENFLHQEVTTMAGELHNAGAEAVSSLSLTAEFSDDMNQIVLRETRKILSAPVGALAPGEKRAFEVSFDHIPESWNRQTPTVRVSHLQLASQKQ